MQIPLYRIKPNHFFVWHQPYANKVESPAFPPNLFEGRYPMTDSKDINAVHPRGCCSLAPTCSLTLCHLKSSNSQTPARAYLEQMTSSRFAIRTDPKTRWANWAVNAIQAVFCLWVAPISSPCSASCAPPLVASTTDEAWARVKPLLESPIEFDLFLHLQKSLAEDLCFRSPLADLTRWAKRFYSR
jgi:hypothetical protein